MADAMVLERVFAAIRSRRGADPATSHVAGLLALGRAAVARKVGEEAVETVVAALGTDDRAVVSESADLLFHLLVLWAERGIAPGDVFAELARREGTSGVAEKAGRTPARPGRS